MLNRHKKYLEEFQPPPKKLRTEANDLIQKLSEKQLCTSTNLQKELGYNKEFQGSEELPTLSKLKGKIYSLPEFEDNVLHLDNINELKYRGLSDEDIELFKAYREGGEELQNKYKNVNSDVLNIRIKAILTLLEKETNICDESKAGAKHHEEYFNSVKPNSTETKLLQFAVRNETREQEWPHPMNGLVDLEKEFMKDIDNYSSAYSIKKIRKKARSLTKQIEVLTKDQNTLEEPKTKLRLDGYVENSLWDCKEIPQIVHTKINNTSKVYSCEKQNLYTIKDGQIVKLGAFQCQQEPSKKLTLEEIKKMPKFANYEPGEKSSKLFLKNLEKNVNEDNLRLILKDLSADIESVKIMQGKMKGQGFVHFTKEDAAEEALELLNGIVFNNKPIIVQFGNKKHKT